MKKVYYDIFVFLGGGLILFTILAIILCGCKKSVSSGSALTTGSVKIEFQYWRITNDSAYITIPCLPSGQQYYYSTTSRQWLFSLEKKNLFYTVKAQTWNFVDSMQTSLCIDGVLISKTPVSKNINTLLFQY